MTKDEAELLFDAEVADPLGRRGFKRVGKRLYATENPALVRAFSHWWTIE